MQLSELFTSDPDQVLGEIDGTQFQALSIVLVRTARGAECYCLLREWGDMPASHLINQQVIIQSQQAQLELVNQQLQSALKEVHHTAWLKAENQRLAREIAQYRGQTSDPDVNSHAVPLHRPRSTYCPCESCEALRQAAMDQAYSEARANGLSTFPEAA